MSNIRISAMNKGITILFCGAVLSGCVKIRQQEQYEVKPVSVEVSVLEEIAGLDYRTYVGEIETETEVNVSFALGGKLTRIEVSNGSKVSAGSVIAHVDDKRQRSAVRTAKAQLDQAKDGYDRMKKVWEQGAVAEVKWIEMQSKLEQAQGVYELAMKELNDCVLRSPISGQVDQLNVSVGQQLVPGQRVCAIVGLNDVSVRFSVPETEVSRLSSGQIVEVKVPATGEDILQGTITEIGLSANKLAHSYEVIAVVQNKKEHRLLPGMVCKVRILAPRESGVVIPAACVQTRPDGQSVWVIENGVATRRAIEVSGYMQNGVEVSAGLNAGDTIVVKGYQKLFAGAETEIVNKKPPTLP